MSVCLVLWDVDHTLVELHRLHYDLYRRALSGAFDIAAGTLPDMAGRTDRDSSTEVLTAHGIDPGPDNLRLFWDELVKQFDHAAADIRRTGHVVPGAGDVLAALAEQPDVLQSVLTGNLRALAERKLAMFGLDRHLDLDIGGYGEDHHDRAELVTVARTRAATRQGVEIPASRTVLVGDTPKDVKAAHDSGTRVVAVGTGSSTTAELARAGADTVLSALTDTKAAVDAILHTAE